VLLFSIVVGGTLRSLDEDMEDIYPDFIGHFQKRQGFDQRVKFTTFIKD